MAAPPDPSPDELWLAMRQVERATSARLDELEAQNRSLNSQLDAVYASRTWQLGRRVIGLAQPALRARRWLRRRRGSPAAATGQQSPSGPSAAGAISTPNADSAPIAALRAAVERSLPPFDEERAAQLAAQLGRVRRHGRPELLAAALTVEERAALLELETALALGPHPGPPAPAPAGAGASGAPRRDLVVIDARRLQSPWTASDSTRSHALAVLDALRDVAGDGEVVALLDPAGGPLDAAAAALVDRVVFAPLQVRRASPALFVSLAPTDHTLCPTAPFLDSPAIACVAVLTEAMAGDAAESGPRAIARAARLHGLSRYDLALAVTQDVADAAERSVGWSADRVLVTGASAPSWNAPPAGPPVGDRDALGSRPWLAAGGPETLGTALRSVLLNPEEAAAAQRAHGGSRHSANAVRDSIVQGLRAAIDRRAGGLIGPAGERRKVAVLVPDLPPGPARAAAAGSISALAEQARVAVHSAGALGPDLGDSIEPLDCRPFLDAGTAAVLGFVDDDPSSQAVIEYLNGFGGACFVLGGQVEIDELSKVCTPLIVEDEELARRIQQATLRRPAVVPAVSDAGAALTIDGEVRRRARAALGYAEGRLHMVRVGTLTTSSTDLSLLPGALAWLVGWGHDPVLHLIGDVEPEVAARLDDAMALLGLQQSVVVHPPVPSGAAQHLLAADVAVQVESTPDRTSPLLLAESIDRLASLPADDPDAVERDRVENIRTHRPAEHARRLLRSLGLEAGAGP